MTLVLSVAAGYVLGRFVYDIIDAVGGDYFRRRNR